MELYRIVQSTVTCNDRKMRKKCIFVIFFERVFFGEEISDIFFVKNFCLSSVLPLEFGPFFENMGFTGKLASKQ